MYQPFEVEADPGVSGLVHKLWELSELLHLHEEVAGLSLSIVAHEVGHDVVDELLQLLPLVLVTVLQLQPLLGNLTGQMPARTDGNK